jgi:3-hydroxybutyryl-CoA dehydratase
VDKMLSDIKVGMDLPKITKKITQKNINDYAEASGDFNPLHIDPEFGAKTEFKSTIAHGLISVGYISQVMYEAFEKSWLNTGVIDIKFISPVRPDEVIIAKGTITGIEYFEGIMKVTSEIILSNHKGPVIVSTATVALNKCWE